jgi:ribulose-phosphate 3-epimerase
MIIIPAVLTNDINEAIEKVLLAQEKKVERIQIDVVDGIFAKNKTITPELLKDNEQITGRLDIHLMVKEPVNWIKRSLEGGGERLIGHIEKMNDQVTFSEKVLEEGGVAGLAVDLKTPVTELDTKAIRMSSVILLMAVNAGFGGQPFDKSIYQKIEKLQDIRRQLKTAFTICIDGGVTKPLLSELESFGVEEVVEGRRWYEENW